MTAWFATLDCMNEQDENITATQISMRKCLMGAGFTLLLIITIIGSKPIVAAQGAPATITAGPTQTARAQVARERFSGESAFAYLTEQLRYGIRPTGSVALTQTGDYFIRILRGYGWKIDEQKFDINVNGNIVVGRNVIASLGSGPVIIIGAHYDTRLWADNDPDTTRRRDPVLGANDAASGAAVLLELARVLGKGYTLSHEIRLVFLDAEDNGNIPGWDIFSIGTYDYVARLDVQPEYAIILDMIGDADLNIHYEGRSMQAAPNLMTGIWQAAQTLGYQDAFIPAQRFTMIDDHVPFIDAGIPAVDIIDFDYPAWHTVSDTLDKVSALSLEKVGRTLQTYLEQTAVIQ